MEPALFYDSLACQGRRVIRPGAFVLVAALLVPALGFGVVRNVQSGRVVIAQAGSSRAATVSGLPPAVIDLSSATIPQGGAFSVRIRSAQLVAGSVRFQAHEYPMVSNGDLWYAIVGAGQDVGTEEMIPPGDYPLSVRYQYASSREVMTANLTVSITPVNFPVDAIQFTGETAALLSPELVASEAVQMTQVYSGFSPRQLWQGAFIQPVNGEITTNFGARRAYQGGPAAGSHSGVDIGVPAGTPVTASAAGSCGVDGHRARARQWGDYRPRPRRLQRLFSPVAHHRPARTERRSRRDDRSGWLHRAFDRAARALGNRCQRGQYRCPPIRSIDPSLRT